MRFLPTLHTYIAKEFIKKFSMVYGTIIIVMLIATIIDLLQRTADIDIGIIDIFKMAIFKLPLLLQEAVIFITLLATNLFFTDLSKKNELTIIRASGLSIRQILFTPLLSAFLIGVIVIMIFNPVAAIFNSKLHKFEDYYLNKKSTAILLSGAKGIWIREKTADSVRFINAKILDTEKMQFKYASIVVTSKNINFQQRIDAEQVELKNNKLCIKNAKIYEVAKKYKIVDYIEFPTTLSKAQILDSFSKAEEISFWELPAVIKSLKKSGFSSKDHELYFYKLLSLPLSMMAIILLITNFISTNNREINSYSKTFLGLAIGFFAIFLGQIFVNFAFLYGINIKFASFIPPIFIALISKIILLEFQEK